jgi:type II secretory pathway pseudopilin PulG
MNRPRTQDGWSLAELLIALALAAMLMVPLTTMFASAANGAVAARAARAPTADARFALGRIAARAAVAPAITSSAAAQTPDAWLAPYTYALVGTDLVETVAAPPPARSSVIAANVSAFALSAPDAGDGRALLKVDLTLTAQGNSVTVSRTLRAGVEP